MMNRGRATSWRCRVPLVLVAWALVVGCSSASPPEERSASGRDAGETEVTLPIPELPVERTVPVAAGSELLITVVESPPPADELADDDSRTPRSDRWVFSVGGDTIDDVEALSAPLREAADRHARPVSEGGLGHGWDTNAHGERISRLEVRIDAPSNAPAARVREVFEACNTAGIYRVTLQTRGHLSAPK